MKIPELISIIQYKLARLNESKTSAEKNGNIELIVHVEAEIFETERTLEKLNSLV